MSKGSKKKTAVDEITLTWNLLDLPTAQHKAGLAGLVIAIRSLQERSRNNPESLPADTLPTFVDAPDALHVTIQFNKKSCEQLINDVYDADPTESEPREKPRYKGKGASKQIIPPLRRQFMTVTKAGKEKEVEGYVYLDAIPRLNPIRAALNENRLWLKLWHDFLKNVVRDSKKWAPYRLRAASKRKEAAAYMFSESDDEPDGDPDEQEDSKSKGDGSSWNDLLRIQKSYGKSPALGNLSSALLLGTQAIGPERLTFKGWIQNNLLLHFWPLVALPAVPWVIDREGKSEETGYVISIPEVSNLERFCERWPEMLGKLSSDVRGFRPAQAVIDLPAQGALELISSVAQLKTAEQEQSPARYVAAVEYLHLDRQGNNVKLLNSGRVPADDELLSRYREIVGNPGQKSPYRNPLFKAALIQALLGDRPWWAELLQLFMARDWRFFVNASDTSSAAPDISRLPWFWLDIRNRLRIEESRWLEQEKYRMENEPKSPKPLQLLVNRIVRSYVRQRAQARSDVKLPENVDWETIDPRFKEEQSHVAQSLFLEFRSRRDQAFIDHFAQTFFATKQYLSDDDQQTLANALIVERRIDDMKTLTLMALSANS